MPHRRVVLELSFKATHWQQAGKKGDWFEVERRNGEMGFCVGGWWWQEAEHLGCRGRTLLRNKKKRERENWRKWGKGWRESPDCGPR